jgi:hypothetical protein
VVVDGILKVQPGAVVKAVPVSLDEDETRAGADGKATS